MRSANDLGLIRPRCDSDLAALVPILLEVHRTDGYPVEGLPDPPGWLILPDMLGVWVAELDSEVVGHVALTESFPQYVAAQVWQERSGMPLDRIAVLRRLFVAPAARGHGLGRRLIEAAMTEATHRRRRAVLDVMLKDGAAIHTYQSLGWQSLGPIELLPRGHSNEPAMAFVAPGEEYPH